MSIIMFQNNSRNGKTQSLHRQIVNLIIFYLSYLSIFLKHFNFFRLWDKIRQQSTKAQHARWAKFFFEIFIYKSVEFYRICIIFFQEIYIYTDLIEKSSISEKKTSDCLSGFEQTWHFNNSEFIKYFAAKNWNSTYCSFDTMFKNRTLLILTRQMESIKRLRIRSTFAECEETALCY